ncbi:MAG TPA: IlvD/Edd family dehydratase [Gaiellales bacterium]|nr:IlvD/Edd family dehydratase [Gaiellales bacterium]
MSEGNGSKRELRSAAWFSGLNMFTFSHRSWNGRGYPPDVFDGRPVIGICNSWSELTTCNAHLRIVAEYVKRGVWEAGGLPLEFPTISLGESMMKPTTMLWRNLMSMDVEESLRANPLDGVVLLCGCDKTTPAQLMGAASVDLPTICMPGGPMLNGQWREEEVGSGTDLWRISDMRRRGEITDGEYLELEASYSRSDGHCNTMGTASTMTSMAEALGTTLTGAAAIPAADSRRRALAHLTGRRIVQMVHDDLRLSQIITPQAFHNAIATLHALGGSTNAVIHLPAIAGRLGIDLPLERFDELSREVPFIANLKPSGEFLMEEFHQAGGVPAVMAEIKDSLELGALTATGKSMGENLEGVAGGNGRVILKRSAPLSPDGGIVILRGTLAPGSAVIKRSAASEELLRHRGRAYVFENREELLAHIDDDDLPVDASTVLVLKNGGPKGGPGMPEWGQLPIPGRLLRQGVTDMLRISDARMSGTSYGTVVLHATPEAAAGGPLAVVQTGDEIELNVDERRLDLLVPAEELERRLAAWSPPAPHYTRGYGRLFIDNVLGADLGCDFDFLRADGIEHADYGPLYARMGHS